MERRITDDIAELKRVLPPPITQQLDAIGNQADLLEVILDLGRRPTARYITGEIELSQHDVTRAELDAVVEGVGSFDADNRAGMERTLHRISAIRNRRSEVVGLTCRVGRAVYGTIDIIQDLIESGQSILMMGPPGVGKTTMLREAARVLAVNKRVVIVDTSNEIGGDGDVPHPAIGKARRMQVSRPERQHEVMIEAVENHNPEVIVIDEIGRELEAMAARTIAERGVQLIGTAHGNALDNLLLNPTLSDLVGGIQAVTLSDEEARRRGTQKTVLERKAPPTFDVLIEIQTRHRLLIHEDVAADVDLILRDKSMQVEIRSRNDKGEVVIETTNVESRIGERNLRGRSGERMERSERPERGDRRERGERLERGERVDRVDRVDRGIRLRPPYGSPSGMSDPQDVAPPAPVNGGKLTTVHVYAFGVARNRLQQTARQMRVPMVMTDDVTEADLIVTLKNYYRRRPKVIMDAERRGTPIYVLRANTLTQIESFIGDAFHLDTQVDDADALDEAMRETRDAIIRILNGAEYIDLPPRPSTIRRRQHEMANRANLESDSYGDEPERHVRIARVQ
ncbi:MAG: AAA family ATPase [Chloroflexota bacterium]|nr:AAA family ATPase [Chloroflexota bacterium]